MGLWAMRVAFLADKLNIARGGSNFSLDLMARMLSERGHDVSVVTVNFTHSNNLPEERPYSVLNMAINRRTQPTGAYEIYRVIDDIATAFDIIHVFHPAILPVAGLYRTRHDSPPIVGRLNTYDAFCTNLSMMTDSCPAHCSIGAKFVHDSDPAARKVPKVPKYTFDTYALPVLLGNLDRLFALSQAVRSIYESIGVDGGSIRVIPNFYDPEFGQVDVDAEKFDHESSVLYVGTLAEHKGVDILIDAATELSESVGIEIVGDGPALDDLRTQSRNIDIENRVTFHGRLDHDELPRYYAGADVFVHPGRWPEPFARTALESLQFNCPGVVSDVGAPPAVFGDAGLIFERNNSADLAEKLDEILNHKEVRDKLIQACSNQLEQFRPERVISMVESEYKKIRQIEI